MNADKITTWLGFIGAAVVAAQQALSSYQGQPINWLAVGGAVLMAVFGYWTNKKDKPTQ